MGKTRKAQCRWVVEECACPKGPTIHPSVPKVRLLLAGGKRSTRWISAAMGPNSSKERQTRTSGVRTSSSERATSARIITHWPSTKGHMHHSTWEQTVLQSQINL